jgi:outer membrane protein OmpA-like peptidoglycan-associated protein
VNPLGRERGRIVNLGLLLRQYGLICLVSLVMTAGCMEVTPFGTVTVYQPIKGRDIDAQSVSTIVPGTTTKQEIVQRFGEPDAQTTNPDGKEQYTYEYSGYVKTIDEKGVYEKDVMKGEKKRLRVVFAGDVVNAYFYTNANAPQENRAQQAASYQVTVKTTEGNVEFTNPASQVHLGVSAGLAATVGVTQGGTIAVNVPQDNGGPLRMRVRDRFASVNPGTDFTMTTSDAATTVVVKQGIVVVRTRTGCEIVEGGSEKPIEAPSGTLPAIGEFHFPMVHFAFKSAKPVSTDLPLVDCVANVLADYPDARIRIDGHSDDVGSTGYNVKLSGRRAEAIRTSLVARGIKKSRLDVKSYGRSRPTASNKSKEGRAQNRRVEFAVVAAP